MGFDRSGGEAHHEERAGGFRLVVRDRRRGDFHYQFSEVLLVQDDRVARDVAVVGFRDQFATDGDLRRQPNDSCVYFVCDEAVDSSVDVTRVGGVQRAEDQQDLASAVARCMEQRRPRHLESVLKTRLSLRLLLS